jgi:methyltransferase-like protein
MKIGNENIRNADDDMSVLHNGLKQETVANIYCSITQSVGEKYPNSLRVLILYDTPHSPEK